MGVSAIAGSGSDASDRVSARAAAAAAAGSPVSPLLLSASLVLLFVLFASITWLVVALARRRADGSSSASSSDATSDRYIPLSRPRRRVMFGGQSGGRAGGAPDPRLVAVLDGTATADDAPSDADPMAAVDSDDEMHDDGAPGLKRVRGSGDGDQGRIACVECEDQPATVYCDMCLDPYCSLCFRAQHKKGKRRTHPWRKVDDLRSDDLEALTAHVGTEPARSAPPPSLPPPSSSAAAAAADIASAEGASFDSEPLLPEDADWTATASAAQGALSEEMLERAKYIPLRLTLEERKQLRLVEAALRVSEYTDKIDILSYTSKTKRINAQIREICAILSGLTVAADYQRGQELIKERNFEENEAFFQSLFEIARRHKILNPEKMRSEYGKLIYLLQDSVSADVSSLLRFSLVCPLQTVHSLLSSADGLALLRDPLIDVATEAIYAPPGASRSSVRASIDRKERAVERLVRTYTSPRLSADTVRRCLYSLGDNNSFLLGNRHPVDRMLDYLARFFRSDSYEDGYSLAISAGRHGARLSHSHRAQYAFVLQSLTLWRNVQHHMFQLWSLAESDLLSRESPYALRDTGQGLQRVQQAPRVSRMMHTVLHRTQARLGEWVGSSVVHLGDHNVPNALLFIDKYTQIARILAPIVATLVFVEFEAARQSEQLERYMKEAFGGPERAMKCILVDFFRHAFDGSGADNFFDAGSCIDGRLTSAWNWCAAIEKKPFAPLFKLAGFSGFDGDFQQ